MYKATNAEGGLLDVRFEYSEQLWPWSGYLALYIRVSSAGSQTTGTAEGEVMLLLLDPFTHLLVVDKSSELFSVLANIPCFIAFEKICKEEGNTCNCRRPQDHSMLSNVDMGSREG